MALFPTFPIALCIILFYHFLVFSLQSYAIIHNNETDKAALIHFKSQINQNSLGILSSWNESHHYYRQWTGVTCNLRRQRVTGLELINQNLVGTFCPLLGIFLSFNT